MKALIENMNLLKVSGKRIGVFGQMRELGVHSPQAHFDLGSWMAQIPFDLIWFVGEDHESFRKGMKSSKLITSERYDPTIASQIASQIKSEDILLVKGSRGVELERFVLACDPIDFDLRPTKN